jgi:hypothetical protein
LRIATLFSFFTRDISLRICADVEMIDRETALSRRLLSHLAGITFITYGDASDADFARQLDDIRAETADRRHYPVSGFAEGTMASPCVHQAFPLLEQITPTISRLNLIAPRTVPKSVIVREGRLGVLFPRIRESSGKNQI